jgi:hypothetical protein
MKPLRFEIIQQGGPLLNAGCVVVEGGSVVAGEIDMRSKRCEVAAFGETERGDPMLVIVGGPEALHLKPGQEHEPTEIAFPDHTSWQFFSAEIARYTLRVCLVRYAE